MLVFICYAVDSPAFSKNQLRSKFITTACSTTVDLLHIYGCAYLISKLNNYDIFVGTNTAFTHYIIIVVYYYYYNLLLFCAT